MAEVHKEDISVSMDDDASSATEDERGKEPCAEVLERLEIEAPGILSKLPREDRAKLLHIVTSQRLMKSHRGPLPPPEDIALYNKHITNGADRIMSMAEKQSDHRREMERPLVTCQTGQSTRGQIFGLLIGLFGITAGSIVALLGHDWVGGGIAGATVVSLVYAFVTGQRYHTSPEDQAPPPSPEE